MNFDTIKKFEHKIAEYFNSPYSVATDCCTHALELCLRYTNAGYITIPPRTYISVPFLAKKLDIQFDWREQEWEDYYYLGNTNIIDAAVLWKQGSYISGTFMCLSFQFQKHLSLGRGGMILTDDKKAAQQLKKMSYDGRVPNIPWREQNITTRGYHYYMTPETAQLGLEKLPAAIQNQPTKWKTSDWPDLRNMGIFQV